MQNSNFDTEAIEIAAFVPLICQLERYPQNEHDEYIFETRSNGAT